MADETAKTPIQSKYAKQYSDDLAANREEQSEITAQIAGLQERLDQLKAEEAWLAQAQGSLPEAAVSSAPEDQPATGAAEVPQEPTAERADTSAQVEEATAVPQQRQDQPVKAGQPKQPAKRTAAAKKTAPAKKSTGRKAAETTAKKAKAKPVKKASAEPAKQATAKRAASKKVSGKVPAQQAAAAQAPTGGAATGGKSGPPLWQLILDILRKSPGQPCVAREVHDQLAKDHPGRRTSAQTVRNNLQTLVQKGLAEKSHQQGSVMYTAYADARADAAPAADGKVAQAPEDVAEKVVAEV
ncbi:BlaI/MecI/CopY family transcriptional regulator [Streptomyces sp. NPDC014793]|uniref:BlaI/MecI/CopY family transcriptional regulator n=1 Tax=Streptomyces sp. NPDC014793 TaxID=3364914 RepID=UPI0036F54D10